MFQKPETIHHIHIVKIKTHFNGHNPQKALKRKSYNSVPVTLISILNEISHIILDANTLEININKTV